MAVIRMTLENSHFTSKNNESTGNQKETTLPFRQPNTTSAQVKKAKSSNKGIFVVLLVIILVAGLGFLAKKLLSSISPNSTSISSFIPVLKPKLVQDSDGKTNIMLVGIDTRESGTVELNTDTIIVASYDPKLNRIAMISLPRDLAVSYPGRTELTRINSIYAIGEKAKKGIGLEKLQTVVEGVSGKSIQYYAMVDLKGFIDAIDVVGGVDLYLDNDISGLYPTDNFQYMRVSFKRGWNHMNGESALQYSRIRKEVIPVSEGSDFGRSKRQQKVIQAVIDKAAKSETLQDPKKVMDLVGVASKNLKLSKVSLEDVQAGVNILKEQGKPTSYSYVLDLYAGGSLNRLIDVINFNPYLLGPKSGANKWGEIQKFVTLYGTEPMIATMTKKILIYTDGVPENVSKAKIFQSTYHFGNIELNSKNSPGLSTKGYVYSIGGKTYDQTAQFVANQLGLTVKTELPAEISSIDSKEFAIVAVY